LLIHGQDWFQSKAASHLSRLSYLLLSRCVVFSLTVSRVYEGYPYLLAEMYAYSMAAAHERLPHLQVDHYMVSNVDAGGEGWEWVDALPHVCLPPEGDDKVFYPGQKLPTVTHFCQSYRAADYFWGKRRVPHNVFDCSHPLFAEIPSTVAEADYFIDKNAKVCCCLFLFSLVFYSFSFPL
jgi:hypothetical protein